MASNESILSRLPVLAVGSLCTAGLVTAATAQTDWEAPESQESLLTTMKGPPGPYWPAGGIAGTGYSEDFEGFEPGNINGQGGWEGPPLRAIISDANPIGGTLSARHVSNGSGIAFHEMDSPPFPGGTQFGRVAADIVISGTGSTYDFCTQDLASANQFFNTRIRFRPNGNIEVAQVNQQMTDFVFIDTGVDWTAGQLMRVCLEVVDGDGELNVFLDEELIFTGIETEAALGGTSNGMGKYLTFAVNTGSGSPDGKGDTYTIDNFSDVCGQVSLGACCLANLSCLDALSQSDCANMAGAYQGDGSTCGAVQCEALGACCFTDQTCSPLLEAQCDAQGGSFQGENSDCGEVKCLPPGECPADLTGDGEVDVDDLVAMILVWGSADPDADLDGDGEVEVADLIELVLSWGPCPGAPKIGGCCLADDSCVEVSEQDCLGQGGEYGGDFTDCGGAVICKEPVLGACCLGGGSCEGLEEADCTARGGSFQGENSDCGEVKCLPPGECPADLTGDGEVDVDDLVAMILVWGSADPDADLDGDGEVEVADLIELVLSWGPCPGAPQVGACCLAGGDCAQLSEQDCLDQGGEYGGDFTDCGGAVECDDPCPADITSDGEVNVDDLIDLVLAWDTADPDADLDGDGTVDVDDLIELILAWGDCP